MVQRCSFSKGPPTPARQLHWPSLLRVPRHWHQLPATQRLSGWLAAHPPTAARVAQDVGRVQCDVQRLGQLSARVAQHAHLHSVGRGSGEGQAASRTTLGNPLGTQL